MDCTCTHFVREHDEGGCYGDGGKCHCTAGLLIKTENDEYISGAAAKRRFRAENPSTTVAQALSALDDSFRARAIADARRGIRRIGPM